jgi:hypothetical protein
MVGKYFIINQSLDQILRRSTGKRVHRHDGAMRSCYQQSDRSGAEDGMGNWFPIRWVPKERQWSQLLIWGIDTEVRDYQLPLPLLGGPVLD